MNETNLPEPTREDSPLYKLWLRQRGEPALWFSRFERYRLLGATNRSLHAAWVAEQLEKGQPHPEGRGLPETWQRNARKWDWKARAEAWDEERLYRAFTAMHESIQKIRNRMPRLVDIMFELVEEGSERTKRTVLRGLMHLAGMAQLSSQLPVDPKEDVEPIRIVEIVHDSPRHEREQDGEKAGKDGIKRSP